MILKAFGGPIVGVDPVFVQLCAIYLYNLSYLYVTIYSHYRKSAKITGDSSVSSSPKIKLLYILKCLLSKMHLNLRWFCIKSVCFFLPGEGVKNKLMFWTYSWWEY